MRGPALAPPRTGNARERRRASRFEVGPPAHGKRRDNKRGAFPPTRADERPKRRPPRCCAYGGAVSLQLNPNGCRAKQRLRLRLTTRGREGAVRSVHGRVGCMFTLSHYYAPPGLVNLRNLYLYRCRRKPHSLVCAALLRFPGEGSAACSQTAQAHVLRAVVPCEEQLQAAPGGLFFARCVLVCLCAARHD